VKPTVLAVTRDLLWLGKIRAAADAAGWQVAVPQRNLDVTQMLLDGDTGIVVLDLHHPTIDAVETIRLVKGTRWDARLLCFGHHVDAERLRRAREAGAVDVVPNSEMEGRLRELLADSSRHP
jgi:DNA-binding response OmpR family regulator